MSSQDAASSGGAPRPAASPKKPKSPARPSSKKVGVTESPSRPSTKKVGATTETNVPLPEEIEVEQAQQIFDKPHQASYFVPGKVEGRPVQFLIDTGCTTNLLAKHVFDRLPEKIRSQKREYAKYGLLADGTRLPFYGILQLDVRLRQVKTTEVFIISQLNEDAILGMPFLVERQCRMDFKRPVLLLDGQELKCTDRQGRLLSNQIQAVRREVLLPESEKTVLCRVTSRNYCPTGLVEAFPEGVPLAASLNTPNSKGQLLVRCLNPSKQPVELKSGAVIGTYTGVDDQEVESQPCLEEPECLTAETEVPEHVRDLFTSARRNCSSTEQEEELAKLLRKYGPVFS